MAIIGISSIHLLRTFIGLGASPGTGLGASPTSHAAAPMPPVSMDGVMWQSIIHGLFILSAIGIAYVDGMGRDKH